MKKEVFLAIIIGIIFGLTVMLAFDTKKKDGLGRATPSPSNSLPPTTPPEKMKEDIFLTVSEPDSEAVSSQEKIILKGKTNPLATIVIIWEKGENILVANEDGQFETEINLSPGPNEIEISAYNENGLVTKKILTVTYSTAKF